MQRTGAGFVNVGRGAYRDAHGHDSLVTGNVRGPPQTLPPALPCTRLRGACRPRVSRAPTPLRVPSQVRSCVPDALYHLLIQAANMRICINAVRAIMMPEGDTPIEIVEAFASGYSCTVTLCTESFTHGKKGGLELQLLKQEQGLYLVLLDILQGNGSIDRHAVAYNGFYVLDNGQCASLASNQPPSPRLPRTASRAPLAFLTARLSLGRVQA